MIAIFHINITNSNLFTPPSVEARAASTAISLTQSRVISVHSRRGNDCRTVKSPGTQVSSLLSRALYIMERNPTALEVLC